MSLLIILASQILKVKYVMEMQALKEWIKKYINIGIHHFSFNLLIKDKFKPGTVNIPRYRNILVSLMISWVLIIQIFGYMGLIKLPIKLKIINKIKDLTKKLHHYEIIKQKIL